MNNAFKIFQDKITYYENKDDALENADALLILTEWEEFKTVDYSKINTFSYLPIAGKTLVCDGDSIAAATPDDPGAKSEGSFLPRTVCWGRFIRLENGTPTDKAVYVFNTHLDLGFQGKLEGAIILTQFIAKRKHKDPVIVTGDMNCSKSSMPMRYLAGKRIKTKISDKRYNVVSPVKLQDVYAVVHPKADETTYHSWGRKSSGKRIDFIWTSPDLTPVSCRVIKDAASGAFLSDHYPVEAVVHFF